MSEMTYFQPTYRRPHPGGPVDLSTAIWGAAGTGGLLTGLFWMLARGAIVTRRENEGRLADKDKIIATLEKTIEVKDAQLEKLAVVGETTIKILSSIEGLAQQRRSKA